MGTICHTGSTTLAPPVPPSTGLQSSAKLTSWAAFRRHLPRRQPRAVRWGGCLPRLPLSWARAPQASDPRFFICLVCLSPGELGASSQLKFLSDGSFHTYPGAGRTSSGSADVQVHKFVFFSFLFFFNGQNLDAIFKKILFIYY